MSELGGMADLERYCTDGLIRFEKFIEERSKLLRKRDAADFGNDDAQPPASSEQTSSAPRPGPRHTPQVCMV